jgi:hypothetical protein
MSANKVADYTATGVAASAPVWGTALDYVNQWLTAISLVLGIAFLLWRWRRSAKAGYDNGEI